MNWELDDLVISKVQEVFHDFDHLPDFDLDACYHFVLYPDIVSPLDHFSVNQFVLDKAGQLLIG